MGQFFFSSPLFRAVLARHTRKIKNFVSADFHWLSNAEVCTSTNVLRRFAAIIRAPGDRLAERRRCR